MANRNHSNRKLPKSLTTVTTLSKTIAMILFITLPFLGFYLGFQYSYVLNQANQIQEINMQKPVPTPTCRPRPACLDAKPRCMIAETSDMCPPKIIPSP